MARRSASGLADSSASCAELVKAAARLEQRKLRYVFLQVLQARTPSFWKTLREALSDHGDSAVQHWRFREAVPAWQANLDDPWLMQVVCDTLNFWSEIPDSPGARLEPKFDWFYYDVLASIPAFAPVFPDPRPRRPNATEARMISEAYLVPFEEGRTMTQERLKSAESLDAFDARMSAAFRAYMEAYKGYLRGENRPCVRVHAEWTLCVLSGFSCRKIRDEEYRNHQQARYGDNREKAIYQAVRRFASEAGLKISWPR